ncbi:MAG: SPOR domain-containing protein [Bacteroidales bacterium]|nr:SPOR domain-containing protein [Bacteroidales bacterium]
MRKVILLLAFFSITAWEHPILAQTQGTLGKRFFSNWSIGIGGGPNIFFGDLKVYNFWPVSQYNNEWRFAGVFNLSRQFSHVFSVRAQALYGGISGTKRLYKNGAPCYQYFEGNIFEYNINATINFVNLFFPYKPNWKFFVYGTVGVGFSNWLTKVKDLNTDVEISGSGTPSDWTTEIVIPAGLGAYYSIGDKVNLGLEWTLRAVNSDKLDATVGGFHYDMYSLLSFNVTYNFNRRTKHEVPAKPAGPVIPAPLLLPKTAETKEQSDTINSINKTDTAALEEKERETGVDSLFLPEETADTGFIIPGEKGPSVRGISYRVQVFAFKTNFYTAEDIRKRFKIKQTVYKEYSEGWYRYTLGSYTSLRTARSMMNKVRSAYRIYDAFVARYKDGIRYPVGSRK